MSKIKSTFPQVTKTVSTEGWGKILPPRAYHAFNKRLWETLQEEKVIFLASNNTNYPSQLAWIFNGSKLCFISLLPNEVIFSPWLSLDMGFQKHLPPHHIDSNKENFMNFLKANGTEKEIEEALHRITNFEMLDKNMTSKF